MNKTSTISIIVLIVLSLSAVSCSIDPISPTEDNDQLATRSFDQLKPEDFRVTRADLEAYLCLVANGNGIDLSNDAGGPQFLAPDRKRCYYKDIKIRAYPNESDPAFYIVNYPTDRWEIVSTDKRTFPVLAAGKGRFVLDSVNMNMKGWLKSISNRIQYLKKNSCPVKNAEEMVTIWDHKIVEGNRWRKGFYGIESTRPNVEQFAALQTDSSVLTRSGSAPDTSYHPAPGHYQLNTFDNYTFSSQSRLTSTTWGGGAPYNQYCPIYSDIPSMHANAGSEAVAGGQMVYYMHYNCDLCPEVYSAAFCTAHIGDDPMDWTNMEQYNKSSANWANFQTSDSSRMAAVMLANIGSVMQMTYGLNYSYGSLAALQGALYDEYGLESFEVSFSDPTVNALGEVREMLVDYGIPSIIHSDGDGNGTPPYTFIVDGYRLGYYRLYGVYIYSFDNPEDEALYYNNWPSTPAFLIAQTPVTHFYMNWGYNGAGNEIVFTNEQDWSFAYGDYSNRESMLSFRMDGSTPWDGNEGGNSK